MERSSLSFHLQRWIPALLWMAVIFAFSHRPNIETGVSCDFALKKTAHLLEYGLLALTLYLGFNGTIRHWSFRSAGWAWSASILFAISDEIHQAFIPTRTAHPRDVLIDVVGACLALAILKRFHRK